MNRRLPWTARGPFRAVLGVLAFLGTAALVGEVSTGPVEAGGWMLSVNVSGWIALAAIVVAVAILWLRRSGRSRPAEPPPSVAIPEIVVAPTIADGTPSVTIDEERTSTPMPIEREQAAYVERLLVKTPRAITLVEVDDVARIEADGRYVKLHAADGMHLAQYSLAELEAMLDPRRFVRVHRSEIVNLRRVRSLRTDDYRDFEVLLDDGTTVRLSRTYRPRLEAALGAGL